ncbi:WhiB family transcriptional regulator [Streptomyces chartreusis]|uniref:WhiB family transcriptional regulator n=1 Tax=Streptomyces chartreusis TaxID=1969 RepID=UPI003718FD3A
MSSSIASRLDPKAANEALTDHPHYKYRGCAPDPDDPRLAAGDPSLSVDAWQAPDVDGGEDQEERAARVEAAKAVCRRCPVLEACAVFGASVTAEGKLAERHAILGGLTAVERTKALVQERQEAPLVVEPAPDHELRTAQKLAVLRALAAHEALEDVARAAGLDARTAAWQRARITTQLGLSKAASRAEVLAAAVARGLLRPDEVAVPASAVVAVSGGRRGARGRRVASVPGQLSFFEAGPALGAAA